MFRARINLCISSPRNESISEWGLWKALSEEAIRLGGFDVIVNREGEDIIGQLSDTLLEYQHSSMLDTYLKKIPGISFVRDTFVPQDREEG